VVGVEIPQNNSVMFSSLSGDKLGIWVAHGEGKFSLPESEEKYNVVARYNYAEYPGNPNGSDYNVAGICSADGRHLAMMPHLERDEGVPLAAGTSVDKQYFHNCGYFMQK
jgi:phosphoribosylformylglycinamidine synthase